MQFSYTPDRKIHILDRLAWSEMFESFLANKFAAAKRFGLEGCETLIPGMKALIDRSTDMGVDSIVMGMPHRGVPLFPHICLCAERPSCVLFTGMEPTKVLPDLSVTVSPEHCVAAHL